MTPDPALSEAWPEIIAEARAELAALKAARADPTPTIAIIDGLAVLDWPGPNPSTIQVTREVFEQSVATYNELAALKARRCDGCAHGDMPLPKYAVDEIGVGCLWLRGEWRFKPDHACNAWQPREAQP